MDGVYVVLLLAIIDGMDQGLVSPSMGIYIDSLGGNRHIYGQAIAVFFLMRLLCLPLFGLIADRGTAYFSRVFKFALALGALGGVVYSLAPAASSSGPEMIVFSRAILGMASANSAAEVAFLALHVDVDRRTRFLGMRQLIYTLSITVSPILNSLFVEFPTKAINGNAVFSSYTYCGYTLLLANLIVLLVYLTSLTVPQINIRSVSGANTSLVSSIEEPFVSSQSQDQASELILDDNDDATDTSIEVPSEGGILYHFYNLRESGAWLFFLTSFQNNFNQQVVQWSIPLIVLDAFGWTQKETGYIFAGFGFIGFLSISLVVFLSKYFSDRILFVTFQSLVGIGIISFLSIHGCSNTTSISSKSMFLAIVFVYWLGAFGQIPVNIGLYSKLVGPKMQGKYHASLQMCMAVSRMISGHLVGTGYSSKNGVCMLWSITLALWAVQIPFVFVLWKKLSPHAIERIYSNVSG